MRALRLLSFWAMGLLSACAFFPELDGLTGAPESTPVDPPENREDASTDAKVDASDAGPSEAAPGWTPCPSGRGAPMVQVERDGGSFCIDKTEATVAQYAAFTRASDEELSTVRGALADGYHCDAELPTRASVLPAVAQAGDTMPIRWVSWCQAKAYCAWAGKRLCGAVGGGSTDGRYNIPPTSHEWGIACSSNGLYAYAYGPQLVAGACATQRDAGPVPTGSMPMCATPSGVLDLMGNVEEWVEGFDYRFGTDAGGAPTCAATHGGAFDGPAFDCSVRHGICVTNGQVLPGGTPAVGIRCCADAATPP